MGEKKKKVVLEIEFRASQLAPGNDAFQKKTFKDETSAMEWCRRNYKKIARMNNFWTGGKEISHWDVMDALNGRSRSLFDGLFDGMTPYEPEQP